MTFDLIPSYTLSGQVVAPEHEHFETAPSEKPSKYYSVSDDYGDSENYLVMRGTLDKGHPYLASKMKLRYVPEYVADAEKSHENIDKMADDLTNAYFRNSETGARIRRSYAEIMERKAAYDKMPEGDPQKRPLGSLIVGAVVLRMQQLAHQIHRNGCANEPLEAGAPKPEVEAGELYAIVLDPDIVGNVRRRSGAPDIDGELLLLLTDSLKAVGKPDNEGTSTFMYQSRAEKIAAAMNMIDVVGEELMQLAEKLPESVREETKETVQNFTKLALAAAGIPSSYKDAYDVCRINYKAASEALRNQYNAMKDNGQDMTIPDAMTTGMKLMEDMVRVRLPRPQSVERFIDSTQSLIIKNTQSDNIVDFEHYRNKLSETKTALSQLKEQDTIDETTHEAIEKVMDVISNAVQDITELLPSFSTEVSPKQLKIEFPEEKQVSGGI